MVIHVLLRGPDFEALEPGRADGGDQDGTRPAHQRLGPGRRIGREPGNL
jgi:hypothetical protein